LSACYRIVSYRSIKAAWKRCVFRWLRKLLNVPEERTDTVREFQIVQAAAWKDREPKIRLIQGTCKRLEEKDDIRTHGKDDTVP